MGSEIEHCDYQQLLTDTYEALTSMFDQFRLAGRGTNHEPGANSKAPRACPAVKQDHARGAMPMG